MRSHGAHQLKVGNTMFSSWLSAEAQLLLSGDHPNSLLVNKLLLAFDKTILEGNSDEDKNGPI